MRLVTCFAVLALAALLAACGHASVQARSAGSANPGQPVLQIHVSPSGVLVDSRPVTLRELDRLLQSLHKENAVWLDTSGRTGPQLQLAWRVESAAHQKARVKRLLRKVSELIERRGLTILSGPMPTVTWAPSPGAFAGP